MRPARTAAALLTLLVASACASSYAEPNRPSPSFFGAPSYGGAERHDLVGESGRPMAVTHEPWSEPASVPYSPYGVELIGGDFRQLSTYYQGGRAYVMGTIGDRYRVRITNPTSRRVEAVVSVDGLDAIDGKTASFEDKRGYVILPYGEVTLDGFRTSLQQVATFRFSSVRDSYAGRKGQDRNVGVIGVAFFPERERPVRYVPRPYEQSDRARGSYDGPPPAKAAPAPYDGAGSATRSPGSAAPSAEARKESSGGYGPRAADAASESDRPGLGTEFGERRYSSVHYTSFQRENPTRPSYLVEMRYNDREGLLTLGIPVDDVRPSPDDLSLRESADPFPRSRFASPPPR